MHLLCENIYCCFRSQSKASYLAYRRERGAPDSEGSYKRTMSPTSRMDDWPPPRDHDDPVLLRVTPHHPLQQHHHHHNNHHQQQPSDLSKSYSVDALHHRLEERCSQQQHSAEVVSKLSHDLNKKLQANDVRSRTNENNNNDLEDRHQHHHHHYQEKRHPEKRHDYEQRRERLSPQSVEVLNDRNRQLERERRKLAASCEPLPQNREVRLSPDIYLHVIAIFTCFSRLNGLPIFTPVNIVVSRTRKFSLRFSSIQFLTKLIMCSSLYFGIYFISSLF